MASTVDESIRRSSPNVPNADTSNRAATNEGQDRHVQRLFVKQSDGKYKAVGEFYQQVPLRKRQAKSPAICSECKRSKIIDLTIEGNENSFSDDEPVLLAGPASVA